jgi:hypothetical protein
VVKVTHFGNGPITQRTGGVVWEGAFEALEGYLKSLTVDAPEKDQSGYVVAGECRDGVRSNATTAPTSVVCLDWDVDGREPDWAELAEFDYVAHTTGSHLKVCPKNPRGEPRWAVWLHVKPVDSDTLGRCAAPWPGAVLRAISQPRYVPTTGDRTEWRSNYGWAELDLVGEGWVSKPPSEPAPERAALPAGLKVPSKASTQALATRWHTDPSDTNRLAGTVGAVLGGAWGWSDQAITEYFNTWLQHPSPRHLASALKAAVTYRAGGRITGFPELAKFIGQEFVADTPALEDELWAALAESEPDAPVDQPQPDRLLGGRAWSAGEISAWDPPPIQWLSEALCLAPGAPGLITGYGGSGKTTFVQHLAIAVATPGEKLLGQYPVRHGSVLHVDHEQGADLTMRRYKRLGLTASAQLTLVSYPQWGLGDTSEAARLAFFKACEGRALVLVDSLLASCAAFLEDGENSSTIREPLDFLGKVSQATGATFLVIHHSKKNRDEKMTSARGSSAITDAVSVHIVYEKADLKATTKPILELSKVRYEHPRGALREATAVAMAPRGLPADEGYTLVASDPNEASVQLAGMVTAFLTSGEVVSVSQLAQGLNKRKADVVAAVALLEAAGEVERTTKGLRLVG